MRTVVPALRVLQRWGRAAAPVVRRGAEQGLRAALRASERGRRGLSRGARRHRAALRALGERVTWWGALALLVVGGRPVLGAGEVPERWLALAPFVMGLTLCAALRFSARSGRIRGAALALGALHGAATVLVWTAFAG